MRRSIQVATILAGLLLGAASAQAVPYTGSFDESTIGDYSAVTGQQFNLVGGANTFTGSIHTPSDSSDAFLIGIGPNQTLTGASIVFGTNLNDFDPLFAAPAPIWTLEQFTSSPTIFLQTLGSNGQDHPVTFTPSFASLGEGLYSMIIGNGTFADHNNGAVGYTMTFTVAQTVAATPIPAALPLFASGLGVFGFLARKKKQKNAAAFAAA
ncbi:MAG TPA: hypothetical protein VGM59_00940 [Dongiaceae bacterium]|jgi:hypothetical protein